MLISIITPSFNQAKFLPQTLESVCMQENVEVEHIVVDPGSTDNSREIAEQAQNVTLIAEPDKGQSDGITKGFQRSNGEILAWLNSDDFYPNKMVLSTVHQTFQNEPDIDIVYGNANFVDQEGKILRKGFVNRKFGELKHSFQYQIGIVQPAVFWRRRVFEEIGGPSMEYEYCMDYELWVRMAFNEYKWKFVPKVFAHHRWWDGMKTSSRRDLSLMEHFKICLRYYGYVHWKWLDRYAEYLATQMDGIVNHSDSLSADVKSEYIRKAIELVVNEDMFKALAKSEEPEKLDTYKYITKYAQRGEKVRWV
jgi:glycosyltransferase involved in cell wall biosynthesis